ncbi:sensor histidine kinase [Phaeocystidibacter luteus]|uniref:histidine kinase n=1 Tax=Phaeocystidibacter luteus TaxID=911197 RepID=A0A6N6RIB1_9FLAO|nr:ATP-binding protein [Phaeocystidibacter luteus]KAB2813697.1 sensor histidine kinase [Phaeocystidibacter luteus]
MRIEKPEVLATLVAIALGLLTSGGYWLGTAILSIEFNYVLALALLIGVTSLTFIFVRFVIQQFIYAKVKLIYKNIHELKLGSDEEEDLIARTSDLRMVEREVSEWAEERNTEIRELKEREAFRREFIGNVSHELKTPIFNIQGYILTLLDGALDDPKINKKYLNRANRSVDRMIALVQDMDVLNKLESGVMDVRKQQFDVLKTIRDVFEMLEDKAEEKSIKLKLKKDYDRPMKVEGDPHRIEQVLANLVVNAVKYGKEKGYVEVGIFDMDDKFLIEVADNGMGIPETDIPRIFERFYRVDKSRSRDVGGSGLGLAIVKHIVDAHKQTINVRSTSGVGSTFSFTLKKAK